MKNAQWAIIGACLAFLILCCAAALFILRVRHIARERELANRAMVAANLRATLQAMKTYAEENGDSFPAFPAVNLPAATTPSTTPATMPQ